MKGTITIILFFSFLTLNAQKSFPVLTTQLFQKSYQYHFKFNPENKFQFHLTGQSFPYPKPATFLYLNTSNHPTGIFCKMEYKIQSKSKLAPRFRLGSFNYTEWMEGRGEYYSRYWK